MEKLMYIREIPQYFSSALERLYSIVHKASSSVDSHYCHLLAFIISISLLYAPLVKLSQEPTFANISLLIYRLFVFCVHTLGNAFIAYFEKKMFDARKRQLIEMNSRKGMDFPNCHASVLIAIFVHLGCELFITTTYLLAGIYKTLPYTCLTLYRLLLTMNYCICVNINRSTFGFLADRMNSYPSIVNTPELQAYLRQYDLSIQFLSETQRHFRVNNFTTVVDMFGRLVLIIYYTEILHQGPEVSHYHNAGIALIHSLPFVLMIWTCTKCSEEAEKFNTALASLCMMDATGTLVKNPYISVHFAVRRKLKFRVGGGCFNIDYKLGCSILAACITYLVILREFYK